MSKTQYFSSPTHIAPIHRVHTYDNGAFVSVAVYSAAWNCEPVQTRHFAASDATSVALFAARSRAAAWVAQLVAGHTELTAPGAAANMAW